MSTRDPTDDALATANGVAETLARRGIDCLMIGAGAMAVRGYSRATNDIDLATCGVSVQVLRDVVEELRRQGFDATLGELDLADPIGGVVRVVASAELEIDVVNLGNPLSHNGRALAELVFSEPPVPLEGMKFGVVGLNSLILLKLSAGSRFDLRDAAELVVRHPELDRAELSKLAERFGLGEAFARVLEDAKDG